jgi:hypothetical protein
MEMNLQRYYINFLKPTGYGMHQQVEYFNNCTLCLYCIYIVCIFLCVYSAVRTGDLNEAVCACATYSIN